jgi:hypothetical protein
VLVAVPGKTGQARDLRPRFIERRIIEPAGEAVRELSSINL